MIDWQRLLRRIRNGFRAVARDRQETKAFVASMPRSPAWRKYTAYNYQSIRILDAGNRIVITFTCARVQRGGTAVAIGWQFGQLLGGFAGAVAVVCGFFGQYRIAGFLLILSVVTFLLSYKGTAARRDGVFAAREKDFSFREIMGDGSLRRVDRALFDGAAVERRNEFNFPDAKNPQSRDYWYVAVRFGAVRSDIAAFRSQEVAEQLVLLINEAMRQQLSPEIATAQPPPPAAQAAAPAARGIRIIQDDDL